MELKKGLKLFVDTAPIIYFIEEHPVYIDEVSDIFNRTAEGIVQVVTSVITLIEVLAKPYKLGQNDIVDSEGPNFAITGLSSEGTTLYSETINIDGSSVTSTKPVP